MPSALNSRRKVISTRLPARISSGSASVSSQLITHAEDTSALGLGPDGIPLVMLLGATSVLSVSLSDGERSFGALTLVRQASHGYFGMADVAVALELEYFDTLTLLGPHLQQVLVADNIGVRHAVFDTVWTTEEKRLQYVKWCREQSF